MTWTAVHRRGDVLRTVTATLDDRARSSAPGRSSAAETLTLPLDLAGVRETFADELDLLGALQLRWHTRLAGRIERELTGQPMDLESAVVAAWRATAGEMPGVRAVIDRYRAEPTSAAMAHAMRVSTVKERVLLAVMAGRGSVDPAAEQATARAGERIEARARTAYDVAA